MASSQTSTEAFRLIYSRRYAIVLCIVIGLLLVYEIMFSNCSLANRINFGGQHGTDTASASRPRFRDLFYSHTGNIADKWLNYFELYDQYYGEFIGRSPTFLEVGVFNGGSLQLWQRYFENARVFGVDINPNVCKMPPLGPNITTFCFDIKDMARFNQYFGEKAMFDIIMDDASHRNEDIISAFCNLFPRVRPGGVYLIEDTHALYGHGQNGEMPPRDPESAIQFFQVFIDFLHYFYTTKNGFRFQDGSEQVEQLRVDHLRGTNFSSQGLSSSRAYIVKWLHSVSFYDSVIVLRKHAAPKLEGFGRLMIGQFDPAVPIIELAKRMNIFYNLTANAQQG